MNFDFPHRRLNALTGEWILVSPHRAKRPWLGQVEKAPPENLPTYDPTCYLCPGNQRAEGKRNPQYTSTFVFDNDFPALLPDAPAAGQEPAAPESPPAGLFAAQPERGICRVVCFSPRHDLSMPELSQAEVEEVILTWIAQTADLGGRDFISYVQVFENRTAMMGASNPHPHSQIWTSSHVPNEPAKETASQADYLARRGACLLCDYLEAERKRGERIVVSNDHFTALVPFWAVWPFEVMLVAHRHVDAFPNLSGPEVSALAELLRRLTTRYDNLFEVTFPYSMGFHGAPTDGQPHPEWHFHAHYYPPLLRSATVRKFMVGYEMLGNPQRDLTPETAAGRLRDLSEVHYRSLLRQSEKDMGTHG
jgi:UDPglucose--hexose-1-phosphate uridylyltransferase